MALEDNVYENIHVYDGEDSEVAVAPKGTTLQEGVGPADTPAEVVGWIDPDGVEESNDQSAESWRGWQGNKVVKRKVTESEITYTIKCLEENAVVHGLKTRGAEVTKVTDGDATYAKTVRNRETATDERVWRIRWIADDGSEKVAIFLGTHTLSGSIPHQATEMTVHEFEVTPIGDVTEFTTNASIVAAAEAA